MDLNEIGWKGVEWIHLDEVKNKWRAVVKCAMMFPFA
jgi:hypothetical protein